MIGKVSKVSHYVSVGEGLRGPDFAKDMADQLAYSGIPVKYEEVCGIKRKQSSFIVETKEGEYSCKQVICASGSSLKDLEIDSKGYAFNHWPLGNEDKIRDKTVIINGGSDGAAKEAIYISKFAKEVHIIQD